MPSNAPRFTCAADWSGARNGVRKKLWLAEADAGRLVRLEAGRDRDELVRYLAERVQQTSELVVGLDFSFSLPAWFMAEHGYQDASELWAFVARDGERWIDECPAPFWGKRGTRRPAGDPARSFFRRTESDRVPMRGILPKSTFQLAGPGAVGVGSLRGMPYLSVLRAHGFSIWPFDPPRLPLVVEIYPRWLTGPVRKSNPSARRLYLSTHLAGESAALLELAASSEDAFDAAVSALRMSREAFSFARLPSCDEPIWRLEGRIWRPPPR